MVMQVSPVMLEELMEREFVAVVEEVLVALIEIKGARRSVSVEMLQSTKFREQPDVPLILNTLVVNIVYTVDGVMVTDDSVTVPELTVKME